MKIYATVLLLSCCLYSCHTVSRPKNFKTRNFPPVAQAVSLDVNFDNDTYVLAPDRNTDSMLYYIAKHSNFILLDPVYSHPYKLSITRKCNKQGDLIYMANVFRFSVSFGILPMIAIHKCRYNFTVSGPRGEFSGNEIESKRKSYYSVLSKLVRPFYGMKKERGKEEEARRVIAAIEEDLNKRLPPDFFILPEKEKKKPEKKLRVLFSGFVFKTGKKNIVVTAKSGFSQLRPGQVLVIEKPGEKITAGKAVIRQIHYTYLDCVLTEGNSVDKYDHVLLYSREK